MLLKPSKAFLHVSRIGYLNAADLIPQLYRVSLLLSILISPWCSIAHSWTVACGLCLASNIIAPHLLVIQHVIHTNISSLLQQVLSSLLCRYTEFDPSTAPYPSCVYYCIYALADVDTPIKRLIFTIYSNCVMTGKTLRYTATCDLCPVCVIRARCDTTLIWSRSSCPCDIHVYSILYFGHKNTILYTSCFSLLLLHLLWWTTAHEKRKQQRRIY